MGQQSPYLLVKQLEGQMLTILGGLDAPSASGPVQALVRDIRNQVIDTRLDIRDYELSETRQEQLKLRRSSIQRLEALQQNMLRASEYNIFSAIEIAHLSAQIDCIAERLE